MSRQNAVLTKQKLHPGNIFIWRCVSICLVVLFIAARAYGDDSQESVSKSSGNVALFLRVPSSLPLVNTEQKLQARIRPSGNVPASAKLQFFQRQGEKLLAIGQPHPVDLKLNAGQAEIVFLHSWTPDREGKFELLVELSFDNKRTVEKEGHTVIKTAMQKVTAISRPLHFHYWHLKPELRYVTEGMMNERKNIDYWTDRGAIAQHWEGGLYYYRNNICKTPGSFAEKWTSKATRIWPGIVIDETGDCGEIDTILGKALLESKKLRPDGYIALYVITPGKGAYLADFHKAADRILVETYQSHAGYGYKRIETRYQEAVDGGLQDKSLVVLGLGKFGITTSEELRRQFHFVRYRFPQSGGIAFFGSMEPIYPAINRMIERFFIAPVLRADATDSSKLRVENIGCMAAPASSVSLCDDRGKKYTFALPPLNVHESREIDMPSTGLRPLSDYTGNVLVLGPPLLWDEEPAEERTGATDPWPLLEKSANRFEEFFQKQPALLFPANHDKKEKAELITAICKLPGVTEDGFEMDFDLDTIRAGFYGSIGMGLSDKDGNSSLKLILYRGDYETANYLQLLYQTANQPVVSERLAFPIHDKSHYRVKLFCRPDDYMRMAILDGKTENKLWDTGKIAIFGKAAFDRLVLSAKKGETAEIAWDAKRGAVMLRGSSGKEYVTCVYFDDLKIIGLAPGR